MGKYLDTRDLDKRLDELKSDYEGLKEIVSDIEEEISEEENGLPTDEQKESLDAAKSDLQEFEESDDMEELKELENMENEISEWSHGETLIPEGDFIDYCRELCEDIGDLPRDLPGYIVIDWEATAENIKQDYSEIEYQGETYLYRVS